MEGAPTEGSTQKSHPLRLRLLLSLGIALIYFFCNPTPRGYYDYTFRVAENFLRGYIAFSTAQPGWLNEFVPFEGFYYSVFPLGSVLSMIPFAALKAVGLIGGMPAALIAALIAFSSCYLLLLIAAQYPVSCEKGVELTVAILLGTWMWTNVTIGGAWQLALGLAVVGELGAIYFTVYNRRPVLAGIFFALAFGNRSEVLLTAPVFIFLLARVNGQRHRIASVAKFCAVPFVLGAMTLAYNYIRFHSIIDFGYARIPGVLDEPWYSHGIFSVYYIPRQAWEMLLKPWNFTAEFPYLLPDPFSSSILLSSPFLLLLLRFGSRDRVLKWASWIALAALTIVLWTHGNSGGWQFGYRYATVLLPWIFIIWLESSPKNSTAVERILIVISVLANAYATWLFHWTHYLKP